MPFSIGPMELVIVLVIALVVLGPKRLPEAGRAIGKGMREFKHSLGGRVPDDDDEPVALAEAGDVASRRAPDASAPAAAAAPRG